MKPEKHIYTVADGENNGQIYQIEVTRDKNNNIIIQRIFILVINQDKQTTILLNVDAIINEITNNPSQNVDPNIQQICDEEFNLLKEDANTNRIYQSTDSINMDELLEAADKAKSLTTLTFDEIIEQINKRK